MIRDVEYAFFAQLAYLNWNNLDMKKLRNEDSYKTGDLIKFLKLTDVWKNIKRKDTLEPKVENGILMYDEADKRLFGVFGIERDGDMSNELLPYYDFKGWQFIYSADKTKLYKDKYGFEGIEDDGFYAVAFMKGSDIVVAYRGTEPEQIKDLIADVNIGFLNRNHSQLVSSYLFVEYIKELYPNKNIHLTGHSLGGCLAQYAFVCTNKKYPTVTWNALGVGKHKNDITGGVFWGNDIVDYLALYSLKMQNELEKRVLEKDGSIKDEIIFLTEKENIDNIFNIINFGATEIYEKGKYTIIENKAFSLSVVESDFVGKNKKIRNNIAIEQKEKLGKELKIKSVQIYWLLRGIKNYQLSFNKPSEKIKNYYNSKDWTALLQTREGKIIDVLTGNICEQEAINDSPQKILMETVKKFGFGYHGVNDFLLYMNKDGEIEPGKYNEIFIKNLIKTIYEYVKPTDNSLKMEIFKKNSEKYTDKEKPFKNFRILATKKRVFLKNTTLIEEAKVKYVESAINSLPSNILEYVTYNEFSSKPEENDEEGVYIIGQLSNVNLSGIKGGVESQLIKVFSSKEEIYEKEDLKTEGRNIEIIRKIYGASN